MMEYHEYLNLSYKDKMIYKACKIIYENNWSVRQAAEELELSSSTVYRSKNLKPLSEYCRIFNIRGFKPLILKEGEIN